MGITRLYLALCVVAAHSTPLLPWATHGGTEAVEIFFMISGFYMALIAAKYESNREFYASRFLRIYVPYYAVCIGVLSVSAVAGLLTGKWLQLNSYCTWNTGQNGVLGLAIATFGNLFIFASDWTLFLSDEPGQGLQFTTNFHELPNPLSKYLLIPPAWSVGVELVFYLAVPFLNRLRTRWLLACLGVSLLVRIIAYESYGLNFDPWTYRFMPFEMALFLLGMLSCRWYQFLSSSKPFSSWVDGLSRLKLWQFISGALFIFWLAYVTIGMLEWLRVASEIAPLVSYLVWFGLLPILFGSTSKNVVDRFLGDLSYPIYLTHYFIVGLIGAVSTRVEFANGLRGPIVAALSIGVSLLMMFFIVEPLEKRRRAWAKQLSGK